jgi:hypothetical protein
MGKFYVFNRLSSISFLNFEYLNTKIYSNDISNNPEFLDFHWYLQLSLSSLQN